MLSGKSVASPARAKSGLSWFWSLIPVNPWVVASCRSEPGVVIMPPMLLVEVARCGSRSESDVRRARGFYARIMTPDRRVRLRREAWGFAIGSVFFAVGAVPFYAEAVGPVLTNLTFFIGAIFFTLAAFIQLALSGRRPPRRGSNRADRADWWAVGGAVRRHPLLQHEHERRAHHRGEHRHSRRVGMGSRRTGF